MKDIKPHQNLNENYETLVLCFYHNDNALGWVPLNDCLLMKHLFLKLEFTCLIFPSIRIYEIFTQILKEMSGKRIHIIIYYAGHGKFEEDNSKILSGDVWIPINFFLDSIRGLNNVGLTFISDACFQGERNSLSDFNVSIMKDVHFFFLSASSSTQVSRQNRLHGYFTESLFLNASSYKNYNELITKINIDLEEVEKENENYLKNIIKIGQYYLNNIQNVIPNEIDLFLNNWKEEMPAKIKEIEFCLDYSGPLKIDIHRDILNYYFGSYPIFSIQTKQTANSSEKGDFRVFSLPPSFKERF